MELLGKHNGLQGNAAEETLDALLDSKHGLSPKAELNIPGLKSVLELRADMGYLKPPLPAVEKYIDLSYDGQVGEAANTPSEKK